MELEKARAVANKVIERLSPYCQRIEVAGSIRRRKPLVRDIDIVLIPSDPWALTREIISLGPSHMGGDKLRRVDYNGTQVDFYFTDERTWATLLLIRTGSKESNIRLASLAKKKGWHLAASGEGLFDQYGKRIAGDTERSIYEALGVKYKEPWERG